MPKRMSTRRQWILVVAGALLMIFAAPAGALATINTAVAPNGQAATITPLSTTGPDSCDYPDGSSARSGTIFNENTVAVHLEIFGTGSTAKIGMFANDEAALLLGVGGATPWSGSGGHVSNPGAGNTTAMDVSGRPQYPTIFVTDITTNPLNRAGDWQQGGAASTHVDDIFGTWTTAEIVNGQYTATKPSTKNNWSLPAGSDTPSGGFSGLFDEGFGSEVRWNASSLHDDAGHALVAGHQYRIQVLVHDGDQNKSGGDSGELCTNLTIPGPQLSTVSAHIFQQGTTTEVPGGTIGLQSGAIILHEPNPATYGNLTPGTYPATATAPSGWIFVPSPGNTYTITNNGGTATWTGGATVPPDQQLDFFVVPAGTITGHIFLLSTSTEVPGGVISLATPGSGTAAANNPATFNNLGGPAVYGVGAQAPAGFVFVPNPANPGQYAISGNGLIATWTNGIGVPPGGNAVFYVVGGSFISGHIFLVNTSSEVTGGVISIGPSAPSQPNPASFNQLIPGAYPISATAPGGFAFVCPILPILASTRSATAA